MKSYYLSNGIPVLVAPYEGPTAAVYWWVRTGAVDELPHEAGFAHFLEHMHFKDTDAKASGKSSQGKLARAVEDLGGDINAYTSFEQTVYHATVADVFFMDMLPSFGEIAKHTKFLKSDFVSEREVVLEELRKNEDSSSRVFYQHLFETQLAKTPYEKPVIGYEKTLKEASVLDLEKFYRRQYVSGNMGLVIALPDADTKAPAILKQLEKAFGSKQIAKKAGYRLPFKYPAQKFSNILHTDFFEFQVTHPSIAWSFGAPEIHSSDVPALEVAMFALGSGETARLHQALFYGKKLVTDIQAGVYIPKNLGMMYLNADFESLDKAIPSFKGMMHELRDFITSGGPTKEEIDRAITTSESERSYSLQSSDGVASRLGHLHFQLQDPEFDLRHQAKMKMLTGEEIADTLKKWVLSSKHSLVGMLPKGKSKREMALLESDFQKVWKKEIALFSDLKRTKKAQKSAKSSKKFDLLPNEYTLSSGLRVLHVEREHSKLFSMYLTGPGGLRRECLAPFKNTPTSIQGLTNLFSHVWTKGTVHKDSLALARAIENKAATLNAVGGRHTLGLDLTGLKSDFSELSDLFQEVFLHPVFPEEEIQLAKKIIEESIRSIEDSSQALCSRLWAQTLFGDHFYGQSAQGTLESVAGLNQSLLLKAHQEWFEPSKMILSVSGAVSKNQVMDFAERLQDEMIAKFKTKSDFGVQPRADEKVSTLPAQRWVDRNLGREQKHVLVGNFGISMHDSRRVALKLLMEVMGGQSGRLFMELREKQSLAYSVYATHMDGIATGYTGTYIACAPEKVNQALEGIRRVYEDFVEKGPSAQEMKRIRAAVIGKHAMGLQSDSSIAAYTALERLYGFPIQSGEEALKEAEAVTKENLQAVCKDLFLNPKQVVAVVG